MTLSKAVESYAYSLELHITFFLFFPLLAIFLKHVCINLTVTLSLSLKAQFAYSEHQGFCYFFGWWLFESTYSSGRHVYRSLENQKVKSHTHFSRELVRYLELTVFCEICPQHSAIDKKQKCVIFFFFVIFFVISFLMAAYNTSVSTRLHHEEPKNFPHGSLLLAQQQLIKRHSHLASYRYPGIVSYTCNTDRCLQIHARYLFRKYSQGDTDWTVTAFPF